MKVIRMWYGTVFWHGGWGNLEGVVFVNFAFGFIRHYSTTLFIYIYIMVNLLAMAMTMTIWIGYCFGYYCI